MQLKKRRLGTTDMEITAVGLGAWAVGGDWRYGWGATDDSVSVAAIKHAIEVGVNWIDTAAVYGLGHSEELVGRALRDIPRSDRPYVFTKCGLVWDLNNRQADPQQNLQPASIRKEVEDSLRRLGVEVIDLYQFHKPDQTGTPVEESWGEMVKLVQEGKVRWIGVSNFDVGLLERANEVRHVDSLQPAFSFINREAASHVIPWAAAHETGVIIFSPMQSGILTDSFSRERVAKMAAGDWRRGSDDFAEPKLTQNIARRDALLPIAQRLGTTASCVALAWATAWPGVTAAIVGARESKQVDGWIGGGSLELGKADLEALNQML